MKLFKKSIEVSIPLDAIAAQLLSMMDKSNPHAELVVYQTVGNLAEAGRLGSVFQAMNGFVLDLNIEVGKTYQIPVDELGLYRIDDEWKAAHPTVEVVVDSIDEFKRDTNVCITYMAKTKSNNEETKQTTWVSHLLLKEIPVEQPLVMAQ